MKNTKEWTDSRRNTFEVIPYDESVEFRMEPSDESTIVPFDVDSLVTLREIIEHLHKVEVVVFGARKADPVLVLIDTALEQYKDALAVATRRKKQVPATASQDIDAISGGIRALEALKVAVLKEPK